MKSWKLIEHFCELKAVHRKGFCINSVPPKRQLEEAKNELDELIASARSFANALGAESPKHYYDIDELADVLSILFHFAQKQGWSKEQVDAAITKKLLTRFSIPKQPEPGPRCN